MARLWSSGFELNTNTADVEWTNTNDSPTIQTTTVRSGTYAGQVTSFTSAISKGWLYQFISAASTGPFFFRFYFRYATLASGENQICVIGVGTSFPPNLVVKLSITTGGQLKLYNVTTQVGSNSSALSANTWYRIEIQYDASGAPTTHILRARLNGVEFAGATNLTIGGSGIFDIALGGNLGSEINTAGNFFFDDIAINDNTGTVQNSYPGNGSIIHLLPDSAGDNNAWSTGAGGSAGAANNFTRVNEVTPDDATSYNTSNTLNQLDDYNLAATPAAIDSGATINVVQVGARWGGSSASGNGQPKVRIKSQATGTVLEGTLTAALSGTTWVTNQNAAPRNPALTSYTDPQAGGAWTKALLDTAQIGVNRNTTGTGSARISTLWLLVDYTPGAGGATGRKQTLALLGVG